MTGKIIWTDRRLFAKIAVFEIAFMAGLERFMDDKAQDVQDYAQANAPWDDRTGAARDGLTADSHREGFDVEIDLYHTEDYGIWLEVRWNGKFAIIEPTIQHFGPEIMADASFERILL